jgi:hypothetical protein
VSHYEYGPIYQIMSTDRKRSWRCAQALACPGSVLESPSRDPSRPRRLVTSRLCLRRWCQRGTYSPPPCLSAPLSHPCVDKTDYPRLRKPRKAARGSSFGCGGRHETLSHASDLSHPGGPFRRPFTSRLHIHDRKANHFSCVVQPAAPTTQSPPGPIRFLQGCLLVARPCSGCAPVCLPPSLLGLLPPVQWPKCHRRGLRPRCGFPRGRFGDSENRGPNSAALSPRPRLLPREGSLPPFLQPSPDVLIFCSSVSSRSVSSCLTPR